ncbi:MAG: hypothetical protein PHY09_13670 [Desulfuromonadaceae bacterium]|nr:hypothetical protein [Desulfuromonadaceae bacterium]MDD5105790.1 hypothetical protein [Desulfuromonadaceae bacterium]
MISPPATCRKHPLRFGPDRANLCEYVPKRLLFHHLIFLLLFLSPLTFSDDNTPNFQPDCEVTSSLRAKTRMVVALFHRPHRAARPVRAVPPVSNYVVWIPSIPAVADLPAFHPSRAPPA